MQASQLCIATTPFAAPTEDMPLTAGETPICLLAQRGKGCTIQDTQAVTQDNFCPGSSNQAGRSSGRETMADDDYGEYNGVDGYADDDADDDVSNDNFYSDNDSQSDDNLHGEQQ